MSKWILLLKGVSGLLLSALGVSIVLEGGNSCVVGWLIITMDILGLAAAITGALMVVSSSKGLFKRRRQPSGIHTTADRNRPDRAHIEN